MPTPADSPDNAPRCRCPTCPTQDDCMSEGGERLYCARGATDCEAASRGCVCASCQVWKDNGLSEYYYCLRGAAR